MIPLQGLPAAAIAAALCGALAGWQWRGMRADADRAAALRTQVAAVQAIAANNNRIATRYEATRAALQQHARATTKEVTRVTETPFYADGAQCLDTGGLQQLRAAIAGAPTDAPRPAGPVPAAGEP